MVILSLITGVFACNKGMESLMFIELKQPGYFPAPVYDFENNRLSRQGTELGMRLFYDPILSADNSISCASCHIQSAGFTHQGHARSHGIHNLFGNRNTPAIMNLAWSPLFMYDGGIFDLDLQPIAPITNPVEMDETLIHVLEKLRNTTHYPGLFKDAFGDPDITTASFLKALSQFMLICVSAEARYDSVQRGQQSFTQKELAGYQVFAAHCSQCHKEPLFTDHSFRNNGLPVDPALLDKGRALVTLNQADEYKFKVPSLRNLDFTAPYMHDGSKKSIDDVLTHYTNDIIITDNLDPLLIQKNGLPGIPLNTSQKEDLKVFLQTLNDYHFIRNPDLSPD